MKLIKILKDIKIKEIIGNTDIEIDNLSQDTREDFTQNTLYFAVPGTQVDGHDFIEQAIEKGSVAVVCEHIPTVIARSGAERSDEAISGNDNEIDSVFRNNNVIFIIVDSVSKIMGQMVSNFYGNPSDKLDIIAVTGTTGKTSIGLDKRPK